MAGDRISFAEAVLDGATDAMPGKGAEGCPFRRIEPLCGFYETEVSGAHEVVQIDARREPFPEVAGDVNDKREVPFDQFVRGRPGCRQPVS
jgi:hypothetical protein